MSSWPVIVAVFLDMVGFGMLIPSVQLRLEDLGATGWMIGLVQSSTFIVQSVVSPWWGKKADRVGRLTVLTICTAISGLSMIVYGMASSVALIALSRILAGFGGANVSAAQAHFSKVAGEEKALVLGRVSAAVSAGLIAGPALGGFLADWKGQAMVGFASGALSLTGAAISLVAWRQQSKGEAAQDEESNASHTGSIMQLASVRNLVILCGIAWFSLSCLEGTFGRLIRAQHGYGSKEFGMLFGFESAIAVAIQAFGIGKIVKWLGETRSIAIGYLGQGLGLFFTPLCPGLAPLFLASFVYSSGSSIAGPTVNARASNLVPEDRQGELFGVLHSARSAGFVVGPIAGGLLFDWNMSAPYFLSGAVCAIAAFLVPMLTRERRSPA